MRIVALIFLAIIVPFPAFAGQLQDAQAAYRSGDCWKALKLFQTLAGQGNAEAEAYLGSMYDIFGCPVEDDKRALDLYRKSAAQGNTMAEEAIAQMYQDGRGGLQKDPVRAHELHLKAANEGDSTAQANLGIQLAAGPESKRDIVDSFIWLSLSLRGENRKDSYIEKKAAQTGLLLSADQITEAKKQIMNWKPVPVSPLSDP